MPTARKRFIHQTAFALAGSCLPFSKLFAKEFISDKYKPPPDTYHPSNCNVDIAATYQYSYEENNITGLPTAQSGVTFTTGFYSKPYDDPNDNKPPDTVNQYNNDPRYKDEENVDACASSINSNQCNNVDVFGENPFRYKVYYPRETVHDYDNYPLPVYILFHAGGFKECTNLEGGDLKNLCIELARRGFICFTVEYRRGRLLDSVNSNLSETYTSVQQQLASYRAIQDGCGAIRSIMKKNTLYGTLSTDRFYLKSIRIRYSLAGKAQAAS